MLQRIQTVWLFIASLTILILFLFPYVQFFDIGGIAMALKVNGRLSSEGGVAVLNTPFHYVLQSIVTVALAIWPLVSIFTYKDRKKQVKLVYINILLAIVFVFWLFFNATNEITSANINQTLGIENIGIGALLVPLYIVFLFLAAKGIRKDIKLIKSVDRLR